MILDNEPCPYMKKLAFAIITIFFLMACHNEKELDPTGACVKVRLVSVLCSQAVMKIEDPTKYSLGENWKDHSNVFLGFLDCSANEPALKDAPFFYVELNTKPFPDDTCPRCAAAIDYSGEKHFYVRVVPNCGGGSTQE